MTGGCVRILRMSLLWCQQNSPRQWWSWGSSPTRWTSCHPTYFFEGPQSECWGVHWRYERCSKAWMDEVAGGCPYVFQQDGAPVHNAQVTQTWLTSNLPDFWGKEVWPLSSPDSNPLDYYVWGVRVRGPLTGPSTTLWSPWSYNWQQIRCSAAHRDYARLLMFQKQDWVCDRGQGWFHRMNPMFPETRYCYLLINKKSSQYLYS